jgi:hypothetical protein
VGPLFSFDARFEAALVAAFFLLTAWTAFATVSLALSMVEGEAEGLFLLPIRDRYVVDYPD